MTKRRSSSPEIVWALALLFGAALAGATDWQSVRVPQDPEFVAIDCLEAGGFAIRNASGEETTVDFRTRVFGDGRVVLKRPDIWSFSREVEYRISPEEVTTIVHRLIALGSLDYERHVIDQELRRRAEPGVVVGSSDRGICDLTIRGIREDQAAPDDAVVVENTVDLSSVGAFADRFPERATLQNLRRIRDLVMGLSTRRPAENN